jgi:flavorubredoxin
MATNISEIAPGIYRISTLDPSIAPPAGFTFNQFLIDADEPLLFHTGPRRLFEAVRGAVETIIAVEKLRWISFGHVESDECGSMNQWLAAAPRAEVVQGGVACMVSLFDLADRPPRALADGEVLDLGGKRVRWIDTPHTPHAWESGLIYEETTGTLMTGDLFSQAGNGPALVTESLLPAAIATEEGFKATTLAPHTGPTIRRLAALKPRTLAVMHGSCFKGDGATELQGLADYYDAALKAVATAI